MAPTKGYIHKLNVVRLETLLAQERDAERRAALARHLEDERAALAEALRREAPPAPKRSAQVNARISTTS
jgi:hypothetical protein